MAKPEGLYVSAFVCERVLVEKDDVHSAIRLADIILPNAVQRPPSGESSNLPARVLNDITLVVIAKAEIAMTFVIAVSLTGPTGETTDDLLKQTISIGKGVEGNQMIVRILLDVLKPGLGWINVTVDGDIVQRVPILIKPLQMSSDNSPTDPESAETPTAS